VSVRALVAAIVATLTFAIIQLYTIAVGRPEHAVANAVTRIVVLGDSVAHGAGDESGRGISGDLDQMLRSRGTPLVSAINLGINGARVSNIRELLRIPEMRAKVAAADAVILSIGGNDLYGDRQAQLSSLLWPAMAMRITLNKVDGIVRLVRDINPAARVYLLGLYNPYRNSALSGFLDRQVALWDSALIAQFANHPDVDVVRIADLFELLPRLSSLDHFHPSQAGYELIAERIAMTF
jgi:lysophospholipase L1-like esterase